MGKGGWPFAVAGLGLALLVWGSIWGLAFAPREQYLGDVQRIMYVHVPTAWNALLAFTFAFGCALDFLFHGGWKWDSRMEAAIGSPYLPSTMSVSV